MSKPACQNCRHHSQGMSHGYQWQECRKNWSDDRPMIGVIKDLCLRFVPRTFEQTQALKDTP